METCDCGICRRLRLKRLNAKVIRLATEYLAKHAPHLLDDSRGFEDLDYDPMAEGLYEGDLL